MYQSSIGVVRSYSPLYLHWWWEGNSSYLFSQSFNSDRIHVLPNCEQFLIALLRRTRPQRCRSHWHVFTWIWETNFAWYQQAVITGREMGAVRNQSHWIIESADYLQSIKMLTLSTESFSVLSMWVVLWFVHCILQSAILAYIQCAMDFGMPSYYCKHWTYLQWWPACLQLLKSI